jgi:exopolysaccharide biosynthesis predicted pyruvyltransferase EpsI
MPDHCEVNLSQDTAFELKGSVFIEELKRDCSEKHVLVAMRKDKEGAAQILTKTRGTWLPKRIRRPLSWLRDRLVAHVSHDLTGEIIETFRCEQHPRIYRDVACSLSFDGFVESIRDASVVITDRLHAAVFGYLLDKRVILVCANDYHRQKLKGVFDLSMSGPDSRVTLYDPDVPPEN